MSIRDIRLLGLLVMFGVGGISSLPVCYADVLYEHNFTGQGTDPLDGVGVEGGERAGTPWVAEAAWFADGHVEAGVDGFDSASGFLPFEPLLGRKYTLAATLTATGDTFNFLTLGFMNNPTVDTFGDQAGGPWMLKRAQQTGFVDEVYSAVDSTLSADGAADLVNHGPVAGAVGLAMELNTQLPQWTVEYFINDVSVRGPVNIDTTETPITHVGVSRYVSPVEGAVSQFSLTEVIEPLPFRLSVDRTTGSMTIINETGADIDKVIGYSITSESGALDRNNWTTVVGNYDANAGGGNESVDNNAWTVLLGDAGPYDLSEAVFSGDGGSLSATTPVDLGQAWIKGVEEDLQFQVIIDDGSAEGQLMPVQVFYEPGASSLDSFLFGDLDFDGDIDEADFLNVFVGNYLTETNGLSPAQTYQANDFNSDGLTDAVDFILFNQAYVAANPGAVPLPVGALTSLAPEPSSAISLGILGVLLASYRTRRSLKEKRMGAFRHLMIVTALIVGGGVSSTQAALTLTNADFQTNDVAAGSFEVGPVSDWFDSGAILLLDGDYDGGGGDELPTASGDALLSIETSTDYLYQDLGALSAGTNRIDITYDAIERAVFLDPEGGGIVNINRLTSSVQLDLFVGPFSGADGVDISLLRSPIASQTVTPASVFSTIDTNGVGDPEGPISVTAEFENLNLAPGTHVWLRLSSPDSLPGATGESAQLDNLSVSEVNDPGFVEPLSLQVNTTTGEVRLQNNSGVPAEIDVFRILSPAGSLDPNEWAVIQGSDWNNLGTLPQELSQAFLGSGSIADASDLDLGDVYVGGEAEDLVFTYHLFGTDPGLFYSTPVTYVTSVDLTGDFNNDGAVDASDYAVWRENLGAPDGTLPNDGSLTGAIGQAHYSLWRANYGNTSGGSTSASTATPEPGAAFLLAALAAGAMALRRRMSLVPARSTVLLGVIAIASQSHAFPLDDQLDRHYRMGEFDMFGGTEDGPTSSDGDPVGSNLTNDVLDGFGVNPPSSFTDFIDLAVAAGSPVYHVITGSDVYPTGVSGATVHPLYPSDSTVLSSHAVRFDGDDALATTSTINNLANETTPTSQGVQLWAKPSQTGLQANTRQALVFDTNNFGGPAITTTGMWTMTSAAHANATDITPVMQVDADTWAHVAQHVYLADDANEPDTVPGSGSSGDWTAVLYVNGLAVAANNDSNAETIAGTFMIGASDESGNAENFYSGEIDEVEVYVSDPDEFDLLADNHFITEFIDFKYQQAGKPANTPYELGDINLDGDVDTDDVTAFVAGWRSEKVLQGAHSDLYVGDLQTLQWGDLNLDGRVTLADAFQLHSALENAGGSLDFSLLGGTPTPEPSATMMLVIAGLGVLVPRR